MKEEPHHLLRTQDAPPATTIHDYEADETLLARWLRRGMEKGPKFWMLLAGTVAVIVVVGTLINGLSAGNTESTSGWSEVILAKSPEDLQKLADSDPNSPAADWAALRAAEARYREGFDDLPANREAALPLLKQALDLFQKAEEDAPKSSPQKRLAALGAARTLETRNELDAAIKRYEAVASAYPDSAEGKLAASQAKLLKDPSSARFYQDFYAFKPREATLPPGGRSLLDMFPNHPPLDGSSMPAPGFPPALTPDSLLKGLLTPPATPAAPPETSPPATDGGELPKNVFENPPPADPVPAPKEESTPAKEKGTETPKS